MRKLQLLIPKNREIRTSFISSKPQYYHLSLLLLLILQLDGHQSVVELGDLPPHHLDLVVDGQAGLDAVRPHGHVHVHAGPPVQPAGPGAGPAAAA